MPRSLLPLALFVALLLPVAAAADDLDARLKQGNALAARGERAAAQAVFEALVAEHPERPEPLNDLAALAAAEGDLGRARALLERALATDPNYRVVHDNLAAIYAAQASQAYRRALPLEGAPPANPELALLEGRPLGVALPVTVPSVSFTTPALAVASPTPVPKAAPAGATAKAPALATSPAIVAASPPAAAPKAAAPVRAVPSDPFDARAFAAFHAVDAWIHAWVTRDVAGYTAAYAKSFVPPDGLTRAAWEAQRAERIRGPKRIEIAIQGRDLVIDRDGAHARMTFSQSYRSDRFTGTSFKTLTLVAEGGRWRIAAERTGR